mmetsp:Transcript_51322/g.154210  ORF Transcript_51322/g.154210 Transcript_51322/m.154210 type:complete len:376 (-) Transcript_51322:50-1177(-)
MRRTRSSTAARVLSNRLSGTSHQLPKTTHFGLLRPRRVPPACPLDHPCNLRRVSTEVSTPSTEHFKNVNKPLKENTARGATNLDDGKKAILTSALHHVHEHGWTEDALAAGVMSVSLPPATIGLVSGGRTDLVSHFMDRCNADLREVLHREWQPKWDEEQTPVRERIARALQMRLEMVVPYVQSGRWHEGMALGVSSPSTAAVTAGQLDTMAGIVADAAGLSASEAFGTPGRAAIASAFASAELHLLTDKSAGHSDTWCFLHQRVGDLEMMAGVASKGPAGLAFNADTVIAASAVATSLGGAALSLARPAAASAMSAMASTIVPQIMTFMQPKQDPSRSGTGFSRPSSQGTKASDYDLDDLPPFEPNTRPSVKVE